MKEINIIINNIYTSNLAQFTGVYHVYNTLYCLVVEAGFYSDMLECLPEDPAT